MSDVLPTLFAQLHREHLKPRGFKKERYTFTRDAGAYAERFNFQGTAWSSATEKRFYINVGVWFPEYADDTAGSGYFSGNHWATRVESLVSEASPQWDVDAATDLDALSTELANLIDAASAKLAGKIEDVRGEYLDRRNRRASGRASDV